MKTSFRKITALISILTMLSISCAPAVFASDIADEAAAISESGETASDSISSVTGDISTEKSDDDTTLSEDTANGVEQPDGNVSDPSASDGNSDSSQPENDGSTQEQGNDQGTDENEAEPEPEPEILNGWVTENGKIYYYVDNVKLKGMQKIEKSWYFFGKYGAMRTGWITDSGNQYYFDPDTGKRVHGKEKISGKTYYFNSDGTMHTGWLRKNRKTFYHLSGGERAFGAYKIGKFKYYFSLKSGAMKKGWLKLKGKKYYYNKKGHKVFGTHKIGRRTYYFNLTTGAVMPKGKYHLYRKIWTKSSATNYLIYVDKNRKWVNVFKGKARHWNIIKRFRCSIGSPHSPTPSGTFRATCKVYHFGEGKGYTCWYATGFIGSSYLMHSVVCYRGTKVPSDGRLGMAISHGCIRMKLGNAKWIYNNIPVGSTVFIS